jgi:hypothetical protein
MTNPKRNPLADQYHFNPEKAMIHLDCGETTFWRSNACHQYFSGSQANGIPIMAKMQKTIGFRCKSEHDGTN